MINTFRKGVLFYHDDVKKRLTRVFIGPEINWIDTIYVFLNVVYLLFVRINYIVIIIRVKYFFIYKYTIYKRHDISTFLSLDHIQSNAGLIKSNCEQYT